MIPLTNHQLAPITDIHIPFIRNQCSRWQIHNCGQDCQPVAFASVAYEHQFAGQSATEGHNRTGKDFCPAPPLFQATIDGHQVQTLTLKTVMDSTDFFDHPNYGYLCINSVDIPFKNDLNSSDVMLPSVRFPSPAKEMICRTFLV
jgi:hypothetical protein